MVLLFTPMLRQLLQPFETAQVGNVEKMITKISLSCNRINQSEVSNRSTSTGSYSV